MRIIITFQVSVSHDLTMATTRKQPLSNGSDIILFCDLSLFGEDRTLLSNTFCEPWKVETFKKWRGYEISPFNWMENWTDRFGKWFGKWVQPKDSDFRTKRWWMTQLCTQLRSMQLWDEVEMEFGIVVNVQQTNVHQSCNVNSVKQNPWALFLNCFKDQGSSSKK